MSVERDVIVLAGTNGAGKSSVLGELLTRKGLEFFNPASYAGEAVRLGSTPEDANIQAWTLGKNHLERLRDDGGEFAFETPLGGRTITRLLHQIIALGGNVSVYYVGLESVGLHIDRVQQRVACGGHDIPEEKIRSRYTSNPQNLASLLPKAARVELFDNSAEGSPRRVAVFRQGELEWVSSDVPEWAKLVIGRAFE